MTVLLHSGGSGIKARIDFRASALHEIIDVIGSIVRVISEVGEPTKGPLVTEIRIIEHGGAIGIRLTLVVGDLELHGLATWRRIAHRGINDVQADQHGVEAVAGHSFTVLAWALRDSGISASSVIGI